MALITQKMTPDFMKGTHILDRVELIFLFIH